MSIKQRTGEGGSVEAKSIGQESIASTEHMVSYERLLALCWELYYTSSVQKASDTIDEAFQQLSQDFEHATGVKKDQFDAMRCRFYQLYSLLLRDRIDTKQAIMYENNAVEIAIRLKNAELIAASFLRRARIYVGEKEYTLAFQDAQVALPYAHLSRDPLKGKCYQMAGETQGYVAGSNKDLQKKSIDYFDKAAHIARKGNLEPDGSFVRTDITSIYIEKAEALVLFGRFEEAHNALAIARKNLSPEVTRWKVNLLLAEAHLSLAQHDISSCCYSLLEALTIIKAIRLPGKEKHIVSLFEMCRALEPTHAVVKKLETLLET